MAPLEKHRSALPAVTHSLSAKSPGGRSEEPAALMEMNLFSPSHTQIQATDKRSHAGSWYLWGAHDINTDDLESKWKLRLRLRSQKREARRTRSFLDIDLNAQWWKKCWGQLRYLRSRDSIEGSPLTAWKPAMETTRWDKGLQWNTGRNKEGGRGGPCDDPATKNPFFLCPSFSLH